MRIAILGASSNSLLGVPWESTEIEFWAGASFHKLQPELAPAVNCWFEMHNNVERLRDGWLGWAVENQPKCYLQEAHPELSGSAAYPIAEITMKFGRYFTSTVAYMIALAIRVKASEIFLFGVDMKCGDEYTHQKPCTEYMIGLARGFGIDVCIHDRSPLLKADTLYGYESRVGEPGWVDPASVAA